MYTPWGAPIWGGPPPINVYPPQYPPSPMPQPSAPPTPTKSEIKEYMRFAKAWNAEQTKKKKPKQEEEKKGVIHKNFSMVEVALVLFLVGPFVGPLFNHLQDAIIKMISAH